MATPPSYLIIGAGVFGASTAYHLSESHPSASITLLDQTPYPCPLGASHDLNKIVRADYTVPFYFRLALQALNKWNNHPQWKPYFHQSGLCKCISESPSAVDRLDSTIILENYLEEQKKGKDGLLPNGHGCCMLSAAELREKFKGEGKTVENGVFNDFYSAPVTEVTEVFYNPSSGWADAEKALTATIDTAVSRGVKYVEGTVVKLLFGSPAKKCTGVKLLDGRVVQADNIILCTAGGTSKLLYNTFVTEAPEQRLVAEKNLTAAGLVTGIVKLTPEQRIKFKDIPVVLYAHAESDIRGEIHPPTGDGYLKFTKATTWKNSVPELEGISVPLDRVQDQGDGQVSEELKEAAFKIPRAILGKEAEGLQVERWRLCWDSITPFQDFIISHHPYSPNLYVATGGSFHGWKFLPTIGEYVVKLLDGTLEDELAKRWSWDKEADGPKSENAHRHLLPVAEFRDICKKH